MCLLRTQVKFAGNIQNVLYAAFKEWNQSISEAFTGMVKLFIVRCLLPGRRKGRVVDATGDILRLCFRAGVWKLSKYILVTGTPWMSYVS